MARIRSIKPEFPQSESMGAISRDARLLFLQPMTIVDDEGRTRAPSRMLASLLYPYDDDAPALIDGWLSELEDQNCVLRYLVEGSTYLQICNWLKHQKIDRPTPSRLPAPNDPLANPRESSRTIDADLGSGPRIVDLGSGPTLAPTVLVGTPSRPQVPFVEILETYHALLPELPQCVKLSEKRKGHIRQRWADDLPDLDSWREYFQIVRKSDFLMGRIPSHDTRPPFRADLEWLVNASNIIKVIEGKYHVNHKTL